jgi:hypothetical protein
VTSDGTAGSSIVGRDQLLLCVFLLAHPDASDDEVAVFIVNNGGQLYSRQIISQRKKELKYTRKRASSEAYQAFLPQNLLRAEQFFNLPPSPSLGFHCRRSDFIAVARISSPSLGFHRRRSDFIAVARISLPSLGFHRRRSDFIAVARISSPSLFAVVWMLFLVASWHVDRAWLRSLRPNQLRKRIVDQSTQALVVHSSWKTLAAQQTRFWNVAPHSVMPGSRRDEMRFLLKSASIASNERPSI